MVQLLHCVFHVFHFLFHCVNEAGKQARGRKVEREEERGERKSEGKQRKKRANRGCFALAAQSCDVLQWSQQFSGEPADNQFDTQTHRHTDTQTHTQTQTQTHTHTHTKTHTDIIPTGCIPAMRICAKCTSAFMCPMSPCAPPNISSPCVLCSSALPRAVVQHKPPIGVHELKYLGAVRVKGAGAKASFIILTDVELHTHRRTHTQTHMYMHAHTHTHTHTHTHALQLHSPLPLPNCLLPQMPSAITSQQRPWAICGPSSSRCCGSVRMTTGLLLATASSSS